MTVPLPIGRAAQLLGIPTWRIRDWEAKGLIIPLRKPSGHRAFAESEMRRLVELRDLLLSDPASTPATSGETATVNLHPYGQQVHDTQTASAPETSLPGDPRPGTDKQAALGAAAIRLANASGSFEGLKSALEFALDTALELTDARIGTISYADITRQRYVLAAHRGLSMGYVKGIETWQLDEGLAGRVYSMREPLLIDDLSENPTVPRSIVHEEGLRGYVCVPLLRGGTRLGIIEVFSKARSAFTGEDIRALEVVGAAIATTVENSRLKDELEFFRSQRDNIARHWMTQLTRAAEDFHTHTTTSILTLAENVVASSEFDRERVASELRSLASGLKSAQVLMVNLRETIESHMTEGGEYLLGRSLVLDASECDINVEYGFAGRVLGLLESLISQIAHAASREVFVRLEVREALEIEVRDDVERPNRTDFVQSMSLACARLIRGLDAEARSPLAGYGYSAIRVQVPLQFAGRVLQKLTPKELEVVGLLSRGYTNRELAHELFISPKTLQNHLTAIYRKLGVKNRTEAISVASSHG